MSDHKVKRSYRFHMLWYCRSCGCYVRKQALHEGHEIWFNKDYKESAIAASTKIMTDILALLPFAVFLRAQLAETLPPERER